MTDLAQSVFDIPTDGFRACTKNTKKPFFWLTNLVLSVTMNPSFIKNKAVKRRVGSPMSFREPRLVGWGTAKVSEDGLGAAQAIGSL